jgi:glycosyltransferase involved in cell wall biosynthesis
MSPPPVLLVFSHLRWGFVYQRPQHLMERLAGRWRVVFVEEPIHCDGAAHLETLEISSRLTVLVPRTPVNAPGFHDDQLAMLQPLLTTALTEQGLQVDVAWLYTPMALPLAKSFSPTCLVYDCMDELSGFKDAPRQLRQRESALLKEAVEVFTGGPSLYEARRGRNPRLHCFPSAVDAEHFSPANLDPDCDQARTAAALQDALPHPRLGYFGVIDERLDLELVAAAADQHPEWALVMAGPVAKIDPGTLPRRPNIHWMGMQPYDRLPYLLAGWDVCLMPFALNEATRFISPTKTLEYMAGDKPVVSTPVRDVISLYGAAVAVAPATVPFVRACEAVLAESASSRRKRKSEMLNAVSLHSWQHTAETMDRLLQAALRPADRQMAAAAAYAQPRQRAAAGGG